MALADKGEFTVCQFFAPEAVLQEDFK
jgi:hypothetical protein